MGNNIMNLTYITKDLGCITAYGYAVEKGYTGTEDEYAELLADYANVEVRAALAAERAQMYSEQAQQASESIQNMTVSSSELPEGSQVQVTKTVNPDTGITNLDFGFPPIHGDSGDQVIVEFVVNEDRTQITYASHTVAEVYNLLKNKVYPIFVLQWDISLPVAGKGVQYLTLSAFVPTDDSNAPDIELSKEVFIVNSSNIHYELLAILSDHDWNWIIVSQQTDIPNADNTNF